MRQHSLYVLLGLALLGCKEPSGAASAHGAGKMPRKVPQPRATRVEVATIEPSLPTVRLTRPGEIIGAREADLASALGGFVEGVPVKTGQFVRRGAEIARVDHSMHAAEAELTRVEVDAAQRELKRLESLGTAVARANVDQARTALDRAMAKQRIAELRASRAVIRAPFAGTVGNLDVERGEVVSPGKTIARLIRSDPVHASVSVSDVDVSLLSLGNTAWVSTVSNPQPLEGRIVRIEPAADVDTRTFLVRVEVPNKQHILKPGMIARVEFASAQPSERAMLPQDVLVTRQGENGVFVVDDQSVARWRPLILGQVVSGQVIVDQGLAAGERVVVVGHRSLSDGDLLMVAREGRCCPGGRVSFDNIKPASSPPAHTTASTPPKQAAR